MFAIVNIVRTAFEITGIAFNSIQGGVILEFDMKYLCYFDINSLENTLSSNGLLLPVPDGKEKNIIIPDIDEYLHWDWDISNKLITATKIIVGIENKITESGTVRPTKHRIISNSAHFFNLDGSSDGHLNLTALYEIDKVFPGQEKNQFLCVHSKPVNIDFYETGIGIYSKTDNSYKISERVRTQELSVDAWFNPNVNKWIIYSKNPNELYTWDISSKDITSITAPEKSNPADLIYKISENAKFIVAVHTNAKGMVDAIWKGEVILEGVRWSKPANIIAGNYVYFSINNSGTKIVALTKTLTQNLLYVVDATTGEEFCKAIIPDNCTSSGLGWISEDNIVSAGSKNIAIVNINNNKSPRPKANGLKLPK